MCLCDNPEGTASCLNDNRQEVTALQPSLYTVCSHSAKGKELVFSYVIYRIDIDM